MNVLGRTVQSGGASLLAKSVNVDPGQLEKRGALRFFASKGRVTGFPAAALAGRAGRFHTSRC
ncbi:hypothetical protein D7M10_26890 [Pseudomonas fluorescens]|nr:hypothetical protein D7M10_26890 [Pseudomonas fluorescens]